MLAARRCFRSSPSGMTSRSPRRCRNPPHCCWSRAGSERRCSGDAPDAVPDRHRGSGAVTPRADILLEEVDRSPEQSRDPPHYRRSRRAGTPASDRLGRERRAAAGAGAASEFHPCLDRPVVGQDARATGPRQRRFQESDQRPGRDLRRLSPGEMNDEQVRRSRGGST